MSQCDCRQSGPYIGDDRRRSNSGSVASPMQSEGEDVGDDSGHQTGPGTPLCTCSYHRRRHCVENSRAAQRDETFVV